MYHRLTNKNNEEYNPEFDFCSGCKFYENDCCICPNGECGNFKRFIETYKRLEELEDKIEKGEFVWNYNALTLNKEKIVANKYSTEIKKRICEYLQVSNVSDLEPLSLLDSLLPYDVILDKLQELDKIYIKEKEQ